MGQGYGEEVGGALGDPLGLAESTRESSATRLSVGLSVVGDRIKGEEEGGGREGRAGQFIDIAGEAGEAGEVEELQSLLSP